MSVALTIRNRHRARPVEVRFLRAITTELLVDLLKLEEVDLGITLVAAPEMARLNWQFLQHEGSTDVITFDHTAGQDSRRKRGVCSKINGELFICLDDAVAQARSFRTTWEGELVRYLVHGVLHLCGHDDHESAARRRMKLAENLLVRQLGVQFNFHRLARAVAKR